MKLIARKKKSQAAVGLVMVGIVFLAYFLLKQFAPADLRGAYMTLVVLVLSAFLFITEAISLPLTAMAIPIVLAMTDVITPSQAFTGFSNNNVILFASMFMIGGALFNTGVTESVGRMIADLTKGHERLLLFAIYAMVAVFSAFLSNTGTVAVLLPVCLGVVDAAGWDRKNILLVLAFASSTGGMITLVGTPPNITANTIISQNGLSPFGFFEFAWIGIPLSILGGLYLVLTRKISPHGSADAQSSERIKLELGSKQIISIAVMVCVVIAMASGKVELHIAAALGALVCVLTHVLTEEEAVHSIDWTTIFLFAGTLVLADALDKTGAGAMIANGVIGLVGTEGSQFALLTALFLLSAALTQFMSNTASCALLAPIGLQIANGLGADPRGALMVIAIAASSAFATPMATPPNTLVMGPGKFTMGDFIKAGIPMLIIAYLVSIVVVPMVWPLF